MQQTALAGGFGDAPTEAARAFRAALEALARPGTIVTIAGAAPPAPLSPAAGALILTLCDGDTGLHLAGAHDTAAIRDWIAFHTGAPLCPAERADFAVGTWDALVPADRFAVGTADYPDRSATLIVDGADLDADLVTVRGPGIRDTATLPLPDTAVFAANAARYPLGWDAYLAQGDRIIGIPRSIRIA